MRRVAIYYRCSVFEVMARCDRGEWHWYHWALDAIDAQTDAYGGLFPPVEVTYMAPWRPPEG